MGNTLLFIGFSPGNNSTSAFYIGDYSPVYFLVSKMLTFYLFFSHLPFLSPRHLLLSFGFPTYLQRASDILPRGPAPRISALIQGWVHTSHAPSSFPGADPRGRLSCPSAFCEPTAGPRVLRNPQRRGGAGQSLQARSAADSPRETRHVLCLCGKG